MRRAATAVPVLVSVASSVVPVPAQAIVPRWGREMAEVVPASLLRPIFPLFGFADPGCGEKFLAGLTARALLGATTLPPFAIRSVSLAWIGVSLERQHPRLFDDLRGGCWMPGFPAVGRGRDLLRRAGIASPSHFIDLEQELGLPLGDAKSLYFNFQANFAAQDGFTRVYALDTTAGRLHGMAFFASALAETKAK